jgi:hypothetical protein
VAIEYFELSVIKGPLNGRGLPEEYDPELMDRAKRIASTPQDVFGQPTMAVCTPVRPPADSAGGDGKVAMGTQLDEVMKGIEVMQTSLVTMGRRIDATHNRVEASNAKIESMVSKVKKLENPNELSKEEKDKTIVCRKCNERGHRESDCPN